MTASLRVSALTVLVFGWASGAARAQVPAGPAATLFKEDVHAQAGLGCETCHGKPTGPKEYAPIKRTDIAPLCGKCHGDAEYIRKFNPQLRVDQYSQYLTSTHGKKMATGEVRVATCTDCHGAHGIRQVKDAR